MTDIHQAQRMIRVLRNLKVGEISSLACERCRCCQRAGQRWPRGLTVRQRARRQQHPLFRRSASRYSPRCRHG